MVICPGSSQKLFSFFELGSAPKSRSGSEIKIPAGCRAQAPDPSIGSVFYTADQIMVMVNDPSFAKTTARRIQSMKPGTFIKLWKARSVADLYIARVDGLHQTNVELAQMSRVENAKNALECTKGEIAEKLPELWAEMLKQESSLRGENKRLREMSKRDLRKAPIT